MVQKIVAFGYTEIEKRNFHHRKNPILLKNVHTDKIQVSSMVSSGEKIGYLIGYKDDDHKIKPSCIMAPKMSSYGRSYDGETKWMYFLLKMMNN